MELLQGRHAALFGATTGGLVAPPSPPDSSGPRRFRSPVFAGDAHLDEVQDELEKTPTPRRGRSHPRRARVSHGRRAAPRPGSPASGDLRSTVRPTQAPGPRGHGRHLRGASVGRVSHGSFPPAGNSPAVGPRSTLPVTKGPLATQQGLAPDGQDRTGGPLANVLTPHPGPEGLTGKRELPIREATLVATQTL